MLDTDRALIIPVVACVIGDIALMHNLIDGPITIYHIMSTIQATRMVERCERSPGTPFDIVDHKKLNWQATIWSPGIFIGTRNSVCYTIAIKQVWLQDTIYCQWIISMMIIYTARWQRTSLRPMRTPRRAHNCLCRRTY